MSTLVLLDTGPLGMVMNPRGEDALLEEFLMGATLCEAVLLKHDDAVSVFHGRQPMRDDEGGAAAPEDRQAGLHKVPSLGVDTERKLYTLKQLFTA